MVLEAFLTSWPCARVRAQGLTYRCILDRNFALRWRARRRALELKQINASISLMVSVAQRLNASTRALPTHGSWVWQPLIFGARPALMELVPQPFV